MHLDIWSRVPGSPFTCYFLWLRNVFAYKDSQPPWPKLLSTSIIFGSLLQADLSMATHSVLTPPTRHFLMAGRPDQGCQPSAAPSAFNALCTHTHTHVHLHAFKCCVLPPAVHHQQFRYTNSHLLQFTVKLSRVFQPLVLPHDELAEADLARDTRPVHLELPGYHLIPQTRFSYVFGRSVNWLDRGAKEEVQSRLNSTDI